jgi:hydrogenase/urease accessory protein HupE
MRLEENVAVGVALAVGIGFLIWFVLAAFVSTSIGGGMIPAAG